MNLHRAVDRVAAILIIGFVTLEYGLRTTVISGSVMAVADAGLHVLIFGTITWHFFRERLNGKKEQAAKQ